MLSRFLTYSMLGSSLRPFNWKKGGSRKGNAMNKLGRPVKFHKEGLKGGANVTPEIRAAVFPFVKEFFQKGLREKLEPRLFPDAYDAFLLVHYISGHKNGKPILKPVDQLMSPGTFKGIYHRARGAHTVEMSRIKHGERHDKDHREKIGSEAQRSLFAGFCYQADFTIGDIELVHPWYREKCPIGRPLAGLVADVATSASVGGLVSMANACTLQGLLLLKNAFSDKTELLKELGIDSNIYPIPGGIIPHRIYVDNGELRGKMKRVVPENFRVRFTNLPPKRCEHKGTIEHQIGEILGTELRLLPGYRRRDRKTGQRCEVDGQLDPHAFFKILLLAQGHHNAGLIKKKYQGMEARMDEIPPCPIEMWLHSIKRISGKLRIAPPEQMLQFLLLPRADAEFDPDGKGIVFEKMYYFNKMLLQTGAFVRARETGTSRVRVVYDPRLVDVIYLIDDANRSKIQPLFLSDRSAFLRNRQLSFDDAKIIITKGEFVFAKHDAKTTPARIDYKTEVQAILEDQKYRNMVARGITRSFAPIPKDQGHAIAAKEDNQNGAKVLIDADSANGVIVEFPSQNGQVTPVEQPSAAPAPVLSARERALQAIYAKVVA